MFTIEKGVAFPGRKTNPIIETLKEIRVGDSFVVPKDALTQIQYARVWCSSNGIKIATRKCEGGVRVWRLE